MKKIMFNDRFGLTEAVLNGTKTVTRRIAKRKDLYENDARILIEPQYSVDELLAIARRYKDIIDSKIFTDLDIRNLEKSAGWNNKMFVKAWLMPNQIKITDVRLERLQDITDEDCIKEGIKEYPFGWVYCDSKIKFSGGIQSFGSPREAFASLIDKVAKRGTWESNPYVYRHEFEFQPKPTL